MIAMTMAYLTMVAVAASLAAALAEAGLRRLGVATRWAWLAAMAAGPMLLGAGAWMRWTWNPSSVLPPGVPAVLDLQALLVTMARPEAGGWWLRLDRALGAAWAVSGLIVLAIVLRGYLALAREKATWRRREVGRATVFVSRRRGPAVAGVVRPWIVLPEWVLGLPADELRMVMRHEGAHLRAGDSRLVLLGLVLTGLTAWNPLSWWQLRRLRTAVEVDCDRRVLARDGDVRAYGAALLTVAAGIIPERQLAFAAFSESSGSLHTRIVAMTTRRSRTTRALGAILVLAAALVGVQACGVENPLAPTLTSVPPLPVRTGGEAPPATSASPTSLQSVSRPPQEINPYGPSFTPFSIAPQLTNRQVVGHALESEYPPLLRDAGVGGKADVWVHIDERGVVQDALIHSTSGHEALDQAAVRVARVMSFTPALNRDLAVAVWVSIPITFQSGAPVRR